MSFLRHGEIYPSDGGIDASGHTPAHRLDEFPAGYSLAVCSPALSAAASPTAFEYAAKLSCRSIVFQRTANSVLTICVTSGGNRTMPSPASPGTNQFRCNACGRYFNASAELSVHEVECRLAKQSTAEGAKELAEQDTRIYPSWWRVCEEAEDAIEWVHGRKGKERNFIPLETEDAG